MHTYFWAGKLKRKDCFEHLGIDGHIIIKWMLKSGVGRCVVDSSGAGQ
jgi:hypothetical protein